jgi:hypothetical protein
VQESGSRCGCGGRDGASRSVTTRLRVEVFSLSVSLVAPGPEGPDTFIPEPPRQTHSRPAPTPKFRRAVNRGSVTVPADIDHMHAGEAEQGVDLCAVRATHSGACHGFPIVEVLRGGGCLVAPDPEGPPALQNDNHAPGAPNNHRQLRASVKGVRFSSWSLRATSLSGTSGAGVSGVGQLDQEQGQRRAVFECRRAAGCEGLLAFHRFQLIFPH